MACSNGKPACPPRHHWCACKSIAPMVTGGLAPMVKPASPTCHHWCGCKSMAPMVTGGGGLHQWFADFSNFYYHQVLYRGAI